MPIEPLGLSIFSYSATMSAQGGITVITHGFSALGLYAGHFDDFAKAIQSRSGAVIGGGGVRGTVYINNNSGQWQKLGEGSENPNDEIIFVCFSIYTYFQPKVFRFFISISD